MIAACASHAWNVTDRSDFEKKGIQTEAQLKERIREVVNHPQTRAFLCQPKMDPDHPRQGEQFAREVYLLKEGSRTTVVVLNGNRVAGSAWIGSGNQEKRLLDREVKKNSLSREPEVVVGGRPALLERERHQQIVECQPEPKQNQDNQQRSERETYLQRQQRLAQERGEAEIKLTIEQSRKLKPDR